MVSYSIIFKGKNLIPRYSNHDPWVLPPGMPVNIIGKNGILGVGPHPAPGKEDSEILNAGNVDFLLISEFVLNYY